jgi:hypothetical protein
MMTMLMTRTRTTKTNPTNRRSYANRTMNSRPGVVVGQFE